MMVVKMRAYARRAHRLIERRFSERDFIFCIKSKHQNWAFENNTPASPPKNSGGMLVRKNRLKRIKAWMAFATVAVATCFAAPMAPPSPARAQTTDSCDDPSALPDAICEIGGALTNPTPDLSTPPTPPNNNDIPTATPAEEMIFLVNELRGQVGLPPLKLNPKLMLSAQAYATKMGSNNFFGHNDPDDNCSKPWDRMTAAGYTGWNAAAENIAAGYSTARDAFEGFRKSPGHYRTMVNPNLRDIGAGYARDPADSNDVRIISNCPNFSTRSGPYVHYWVQNFGAHAENGLPYLPLVINNEAFSTEDNEITLYIYGKESATKPQWVQQMRFSINGSAWTQAEAWAANKTLSLPAGTGYKTITAQLIGPNGATQTVSDTIYFVDTKPQKELPYRNFLPTILQ
jgi:uncharacterized protein YkwD